MVIDLSATMQEQELAFPQGYPADRHGLRLGIAHLGDVESDVWDEWHRWRHTGRWGDGFLREQLLHTAAIALRMVVSLDDAAAAVPKL